MPDAIANVVCGQKPAAPLCSGAQQAWAYHHGKDNGGGRGFDDPQEHQTGELHQREDMHLPQWHVAQVDQIRLVLGRHAEQLNPIKQLQRRERKSNDKGILITIITTSILVVLYTTSHCNPFTVSFLLSYSAAF